MTTGAPSLIVPIGSSCCGEVDRCMHQHDSPTEGATEVISAGNRVGLCRHGHTGSDRRRLNIGVEPSIDRFLRRNRFTRALHVVRCLAMLDVSRPLVRYLAGPLAAERRLRGTRRGTPVLTCFYQALLVPVWFCKAEHATLLALGSGSHGPPLATTSPKASASWQPTPWICTRRSSRSPTTAGSSFSTGNYSIATDWTRLHQRQGEPIHAWYSGKRRDFGANIQAVIRPDGLIIWTSAATPSHAFNLNCAQQLGITTALNWAAAELHLPILADAGYEGAGHGVKTPTKQPAGGKLAVANRSVNRLRGLRRQDERGASPSSSDAGRRYATHTTAGPRRIGDIVVAALHLTHFEYRYLPAAC